MDPISGTLFADQLSSGPSGQGDGLEVLFPTYGDDHLEQRPFIPFKINLIPAELLCTIFDHAWIDSSKRWLVPWGLGSVCSHWRRLAWSTPSLWTVLRPIDVTSRKRKSDRIAFLLGYLERSKEDLLSIVLAFRGTLRPDPAFLDIIIPHAHRWGELTMLGRTGAGDAQGGNAVLGLLRGMSCLNLRSLHTLWLEADTGIPTAPTRRVDLFESAPRLRRVAIILRGYPQLKIPWSNITEYHGNNHMFALQVLHRSPLVEKLRLGDGYDFQGLPFQGLPPDGTDTLPILITHIHLKHLHLSLLADAPHIAALLDRLTAPNLVQLTVKDKHRAELTTIHSFVFRSSCLLHSLTIETSFDKDENMAALLELTPTLRTLSVGRLSKDCLAKLAARSFQSILVPMLESLTVFHAGSQDQDPQLWHDLVHSRCNALNHCKKTGISREGAHPGNVSVLRRVELNYGSDVGYCTQLHDRLAKLSSEKIVFSVSRIRFYTDPGNQLIHYHILTGKG